MNSSIARSALAALATLTFLGGAAAAQNGEIPPPPPVQDYNLIASLPDAEIIARLPQPQRDAVGRQREVRGRFDALLDASDALLVEARTKLDANQQGAITSLFLYEAVLLCADRQIRCPAAKVPPRDRLFKKFERKLSSQIGSVKALATLMDFSDVDGANAVGDSIGRLRLAALNSALDIDPAILSRQEAAP